MDTQPPNENYELQTLVRISWLYYMEGLRHREIAERLGLSRVKVTRLLQQARSKGIVQINIDSPNTQFLQLEQALCKKFNLRDAVVVVEAESGEALYRSLAQGAANWLSGRLQPDMQVGLSLGRTVSFIPDAFQPMDLENVSFAEIIGGASEGPSDFKSYSAVSRLAALVGGHAHYIYAPTIVSNKELRTLLLNETSVADAMERARQCDIILHSVGTLNEDSLLYQKGYLNREDIEAMQQAGVVGDISCYFIDENGRLVPNILSNRIMALPLDDLRNIPWSTCVAGGEEKIDVILAALRAKLFNVLITDSNVAKALLNKE